MDENQSLYQWVRKSPFSKSIKQSTYVRLALVLLGGLAAVMLFPILDKVITDGDRPGIISFVGTGMAISLITVVLFMQGYRNEYSKWRSIFILAIIYNVLIVLVKFTLGPASLYQTNPILVDDTGGGSFLLSETNNFNGNPLYIGAMGVGVLFLYWAVFTIITKVTTHDIGKRFNIKSKKIRSKIRILPILLVIGLTIVTGGAVLLIPLVIALMFAGPGYQYLGYVFSTGYGLLIALALTAAVGCASTIFMKAERETVITRNFTLLITLIWLGFGLLAVYHIMWAVYLFVLTSIWPFKVVTVSSK